MVQCSFAFWHYKECWRAARYGIMVPGGPWWFERCLDVRGLRRNCCKLDSKQFCRRGGPNCLLADATKVPLITCNIRMLFWTFSPPPQPDDLTGELYNTEECGWDGGDCCVCECTPDRSWPCGVQAEYACKNPYSCGEQNKLFLVGQEGNRRIGDCRSCCACRN